MGDLVGFDLDDTLIPTTRNYIDAEEKLSDFILDSFEGLDVDHGYIRKMISDVQIGLINERGFNAEVFPASLKKTYVGLAKMCGGRVTEDGIRYTRELGRSVLDEELWRTAGLLDGVGDVLDFCKGRGDDLVMITLGEDKIQRRKVEVAGLDKWFLEDDVYVVSGRKGDIMKKLFAGRDERDGLFIGDSYNNDIRPALDLGIRAIYIPSHLREYDGQPDVGDGGFVQLKNISEVKNIRG